MRNLFAKNYLAYSCLILVSFLITGFCFTIQINKYSIEEKRTQLEDTVERVASSTTLLMDNYTVQVNEFYRMNIRQLSENTNTSIILTEPNGNIVLQTDEAGNIIRQTNKLDRDIVKQVKNNGSYSEMGGTLSDIFVSPHFVRGVTCYNSAGEEVALIFVATPSTAVFGLLREVMRTFFFILAMSLMMSLIMSYFITNKMTRPLKNIANASKSFARGDFDIRVPEDNNCDEIDELAISFNNMANSLEQLEELSRGFVANVSHELKTPMTSIGGFVDGMLDGTIPKDKWEKYLIIISGEVKRLSRLIVRMLNAAKIQSGELVLTTVPFDICEITSVIVLSFEKQITNKNIEMNIDLEDRLIVNGDRDNVFQVIYNLVDNAVKFVNKGGDLTIRAYKQGTQCIFSIKNTGQIISEEDIPHVFDRFYKTDKSRSCDKTGAGLGLYIVKSIINMHGGDISVRSGLGETEFSFNLPLGSDNYKKR